MGEHMPFGVWFWMWIDSIVKLLTVNSRKTKSKSQRRKERKWRLKATRFGARRYRVKKYRRKRRSSYTMRNLRFTRALFRCIAVTLGVFLLPIGLLDWGHKSARAKAQKKAAPQKQPIPPKAAVQASPTEKPKKSINCKAPPSAEPVAPFVCDLPSERWSPPVGTPASCEKKAPDAVIDDLAPKSVPKCETDQYIRKRMLFAAVDPSHKEALGTYLDAMIEAAAVKLVLNGRTVGYISEKDKPPFIAALRLDRKIYAVITALIEEDGAMKYEFEAWFADTEIANA